MINYRRIAEKADLIVIKFVSLVDNSIKYYIRKNRHGDYHIITNFEQYKSFLNQSDCPIVFDINDIENNSFLDTIRKEISQIEMQELFSKYTTEELVYELSKRTNCFVSNNIIKIIL